MNLRLSPREQAGAAEVTRISPGWAGENSAALERLFSLVSDLVVATDRAGRIVLVNPAWEQALGWSEDELLGRSVFELVHPDDGAATRAMAGDNPSVTDFTNRYRHKDGSWRWLLWSGRRDGDVWYAVAKDVTERLTLERRALYDDLTQLANRALLLDHLRSAVARLGRFEDTLLSVLFLDLDGFKLINDGHGHEIGDQVLREVAQRLRQIVRDTDMISRFGGDEFVIVAEGLQHESEALLLADRVIDALGREYMLPTGAATLSCSIGISIAASPGSAPESILREADTAMYRAKTRSSRRVELFDRRVRLEVAERVDVERELRRALIEDELAVHYQPVVAVADGTLVGCEALVRWRHPRRGWVRPDQFIPLAEDTGLIVPLGTFVLETACRQAGEWRRQGREFTVSVNVSRRQLLEPDFVDSVQRALKHGGVPGQVMCVEVTETAAPARHVQIVARLRAIRALGVKIALDDFGAGYSTLINLRELPIDVIKIDRSFVRGVAEAGDDRGIVAATMALARELGIAVIAEGVERTNQLEALRDLACPLAQGHLFAPASAPEEMLRAGGFSGAPRPGIGDAFVIREFMRQIGIPARIEQ
ncbi:MAG: putative bifunctional diguanylate cyclase/phosphodiesterase [Solirubrobacteraceae bacterium]